MNVSSHYWSPFHANDCVFSRNEQQKVYIRELTQKGGRKKMSANKRERVITGEFCRDLHFKKHKIIHIVLLPMQCVILVLQSSEQFSGCLSYEPSLVSLAPTSLL